MRGFRVHGMPAHPARADWLHLEPQRVLLGRGFRVMVVETSSRGERLPNSETGDTLGDDARVGGKPLPLFLITRKRPHAPGEGERHGGRVGLAHHSFLRSSSKSEETFIPHF